VVSLAAKSEIMLVSSGLLGVHAWYYTHRFLHVGFDLIIHFVVVELIIISATYFLLLNFSLFISK